MNETNEPLRVAHIVGKVVLGGVDTVVMNYYRHIDRSKIQFDFFMDGLEPTPIDDEIISLGGRIFKLPAYTGSMRANLQRFREILTENPYEIIHCHMNTLSIFWLREAKKAGIPVRIAHNHSTAHWREGMRTLIKYMLRPFSKTYATHYCACSEHAGRWLFGNKAVNNGKVTIIPNAIDISKFRYNPETRERVRNELGLNGKFVIGHVGRFMYQKNHKFLIKVFAEVYKQNHNAILMLIGDGELLRKTQHLVDRLGLHDAVLFLGTRQDVHKLYQAMDVFVLPSWYEGFPVVGVEAQAAGLPCVISDRITNDAVLYNSCKQIELNINKWKHAVINAEITPRDDHSSKITDKEYDIIAASDKLFKYYLSEQDLCSNHD